MKSNQKKAQTSRKIYLDTNIFLRFLIFDHKNPNLSQKAKRIFSELEQKKIIGYTNVCVISEIVYVLESVYQQNVDTISTTLMQLLQLDSLVIEHKESILTTLITYQELTVDFEDAYTYQRMKDQGISQIYTFDKKHFKRFQDIEIV